MGRAGSYSGASYVSETPSRERALEKALREAEDIAESTQERYERLAKRHEVLFEQDCRDAAFNEAAAHSSSYHLRRGHLIVDDRLLVEHWWVTSGNRIIDPSLMGARGVSRAGNDFEYLPLDPEGEEFDFSGGPPICMRTWGKCRVKPECDWCTARRHIIAERPTLTAATITIRFQEENSKPKRKVSWE